MNTIRSIANKEHTALEGNLLYNVVMAVGLSKPLCYLDFPIEETTDEIVPLVAEVDITNPEMNIPFVDELAMLLASKVKALARLFKVTYEQEFSKHTVLVCNNLETCGLSVARVSENIYSLEWTIGLKRYEL